MKLLKLFSKVKHKVSEVIDPLMGHTVIHFTSHGCMGTIEKFDYIGKIVGKTYPRLCDGKMFYKIEVLKDQSGASSEFKEVPSWYLQDLGGNFFIAYD